MYLHVTVSIKIPPRFTTYTFSFYCRVWVIVVETRDHINKNELLIQVTNGKHYRVKRSSVETINLFEYLVTNNLAKISEYCGVRYSRLLELL